MKYFLFSILLMISIVSYSQDTSKIVQAHEVSSVMKPNKHMVFTRTPASSDKPGNASQSFKGDDFIYGRVFFNRSLKESLFLEENDEGRIPADVYVEDLTNHHSLYISFDLKAEEMEKNYFDFDILPDPEHTLRNSKEFDTGRFSYFINEEALENRMPIFKFTIGDATGYFQVDFKGINLQQVRARDLDAYRKAHVTVEGDEKEESR
jgi:hypothetical protein